MTGAMMIRAFGRSNRSTATEHWNGDHPGTASNRGRVRAMLMNKAETILVNSPPRRWVQRGYELPWMLRQAGPLPSGARVLELGCGSGFGTHLILRNTGAAHVDAVDLDPAMIARARRRLARHGDRVRLAEGSATDVDTALGASEESYDAVFDFAIVHHILNWRDAIAEVARVIKPGGQFCFDEVTAVALASRAYRLLFDHPTEDRFTAEDFRAELQRHHLIVGHRWKTHRHARFVLGVAEYLPKS